MAENKEKKEESKIEYIEESEISGLSLEKKIIKLKEKFKKCREEKEEYLMGWQRAKADFINFKKESEGLMVDFRKWANENLIEEILPILDNFYRAESHLPDMKLRKVDWVKGIIQIKYYDGKRYRIKIGYIGENGLKPNVKYKLNNNHEFEESEIEEESK